MAENKRTIKVRVDLTIEIDLDEYRESYGDEDIATIRNDVRWAVASNVSSGGVLAAGIVRVDLNGLGGGRAS